MVNRLLQVLESDVIIAVAPSHPTALLVSVVTLLTRFVLNLRVDFSGLMRFIHKYTSNPNSATPNSLVQTRNNKLLWDSYLQNGWVPRGYGQVREELQLQKYAIKTSIR